jgi:hypothetical protein
MKLNLTRTPESLSQEIVDACRRLVPGSRPLFIRRQPSSDAVVNKCTFNVRHYLLENPGTIVLGWEISVWDQVLLDCIGHAVVRSANDLLCVSPSKYGETSLLFVPDETLCFDFADPTARMPSKKIALSNRPEVRRFIDLDSEELAIKRKYVVSSGQIAVSGADAVILQKLMREKQQLTLKILLATTPPNGPCFCRGKRPFSNCCRRNPDEVKTRTWNPRSDQRSELFQFPFRHYSYFSRLNCQMPA